MSDAIKYRYANDAKFHAIVDNLLYIMQSGVLNPDDLRDALELAATLQRRFVYIHGNYLDIYKDPDWEQDCGFMHEAGRKAAEAVNAAVFKSVFGEERPSPFGGPPNEIH